MSGPEITDDPAAAQAIVNIIEGARPVDETPPPDLECEFADPLPAAAAKEKRKRGRPRKNRDADGETAPREKRVKQSDSLIALTASWRLWHGPDGEPYVSFSVNGHWENWPVRSSAVRRRLASLAWAELGMAPSSQALEDTLRILEARAINDGPERLPARRYLQEDGRIFVDLCDDRWRCVEIGPNDWTVLDEHDKPFMRSPRMRPLDVPEQAGSVDEFRPFANVQEEGDWVNLIALLVGAMRPRGPYAIGVIGGEQGSGKSGLCRRFNDLIDPSSPALQGPPKDEANVIVTAQNGHLTVYDNMSSISGDISDALCRLSTGSGFAVRALHTDREENIFEGARPILINGITTLVSRPDLSERSVTIRLKAIPREHRRTEEEIDADWLKARPLILGALYDAVSAALRHLGKTSLESYGRMADFERWVTAAEHGLGWEPGTFSEAYKSNRRDLADATFEADAVAMAIVDLVQTDHPEGWTGTATRLLDLLSGKASDSLRRSLSWPKTAQGLGDRLKRITPLLRGRGINIEYKHSGVRNIMIIPNKGAPG